MRAGAVDHVQKPFTADELVSFVRRLLVRRQVRTEAQRLPRVRVVGPGLVHAATDGDYCVPGGAFLSDGHVWARIEPSGLVRIGGTTSRTRHSARSRLALLRIGKPAVEWYQAQIVRLREIGGPAEHGAPQVDWGTLQETFFTPAGGETP